MPAFRQPDGERRLGLEGGALRYAPMTSCALATSALRSCTRLPPADLSELDLPRNVRLSFPDSDQLCEFEVALTPGPPARHPPSPQPTLRGVEACWCRRDPHRHPPVQMRAATLAAHSCSSSACLSLTPAIRPGCSV
jgi:hypothetical protein